MWEIERLHNVYGSLHSSLALPHLMVTVKVPSYGLHRGNYTSKTLNTTTRYMPAALRKETSKLV